MGLFGIFRRFFKKEDKEVLDAFRPIVSEPYNDMCCTVVVDYSCESIIKTRKSKTGLRRKRYSKYEIIKEFNRIKIGLNKEGWKCDRVIMNDACREATHIFRNEKGITDVGVETDSDFIVIAGPRIKSAVKDLCKGKGWL